MNQTYLSLAALDASCVVACALLLRAWRKRKARPPLVAAAFVIMLALLATAAVLAGVPYRLVVGPAFILALLVMMYSARLEARLTRR